MRQQSKNRNGPGCRAEALVAALALLGFVFTGECASGAGTNRPNIIFILADDLGYGDLGCYGQTRIRTPNLDRLAREGMRFTSAYAGSTVCAPSRAVLMTGLHTGHTRIRGNGKIPLIPEEVTMAERLKTSGYATAAIGKWGLGLEDTTGHPNKQGFDEWLGYLDQVHAHNYYPVYVWRNERMLKLESNLEGRKGEYSHDLFTSAALNFVKANARAPFFLYLAYTIPHAHSGNRTNGMPVPSQEPYVAETWPSVEKNKAAMITRLDADIGKLRERLDQLGISTNTVIMFSSDNGPHAEGGVDPAFFKSSGVFRGSKRDLYEGGIRVPFIVWWPGQVRPGMTSDEPVAFWDVLPTLCEIGGTKAPEKIDGISFLPLLAGRAQTNRHEFFYWEFHEGGSKQAVRMGPWKGIRLKLNEPLELYNLKDDPGEERNISSAHPEVVAKIENYLKQARTESPEWPLKLPPAVPADPIKAQ